MGSVRNVKAKDITLLNQAAMTTLKITTSTIGTAVEIIGYSAGIFITKVTANSTCAPVAYLQVSVDGGSNYVNYATLHPDLTTTANSVCVSVEPIPNYIRAVIPSLTTTTYTRVQVTAEVLSR